MIDRMARPFAIILDDGSGRPARYYATKEAALVAARREQRRSGAGVEVAWCKDPGNPKLWLAYVLPDGVVEKTDSWRALDADEARERARRRALLAQATETGVCGLHDEVAILCADCKLPMLTLSKEKPPTRAWCGRCGAKRFMPQG
jgi:hypothetical protein